MIVSIASGKGGTGKTTVATNLAVAVGDVELLDCDVEEPDDHLFLNPVFKDKERVFVPTPVVDEEKCTQCGVCGEVCAFNAIALLGETVLTFPELCHGCGACARLCPSGAITEVNSGIGVVQSGTARSMRFAHGMLHVGKAIAPPLVKAVKAKKADGDAILDCPPGTSCPVVTAVAGTDFCVLVSEPTPFGLNDLKLAVGLTRELGVPCGVVINRDGIGNADVERFCRDENVPVLLKIPFSKDYASCYARGNVLVDEFPQLKADMQRLWEDIKKRVGE